MGESTRHRVSSAKLKILLQPPGWCLDGRIWQGQGLQDVQTLEGTWGGEGVPMQRRGWDTHWGTPVFPSCVPALLHNSRGCSSSAGGAFPAPLWAQRLWLKHTQVLVEGLGWAPGHRQGTMRCYWRRSPQLADMGPPHTPHSHCQLAGCILMPHSPAQPCHNLQLRDCSWQGTSLEINSDDIPANSGHGHNRITELGWGRGGARSSLPAGDPSSRLRLL